MNVTVVGVGHVGLVVGACLADFGLTVTCMDKDEGVIAKVKNGSLPFFEPGLQDIVQKNVRAGRLTFSSDAEESIRRAGVIFVAVGTEGPDGLIQLNALYAVIEQIARFLDEYKVIVIKSTVPVGTASQVSRLIREKQSWPVPFDVVSNPEFLREGSAVESFMRPDRVVIGTTSETALSLMYDIYRPLYLIQTPVVTATNETAELIKFSANAFLAMKISFINEIATLSDVFGCDVHIVARALGLDRRIGPKFLHPGPGYGGSCLPKDTRALLRQGEEYGVDLNLIKATIKTNEEQPARVVAKVQNHFVNLAGRRIAILGLSYKPNTDDIRESPAIRVCELLLKNGAYLQMHDPVANGNAQRILASGQVSFYEDAYAAAQGVDCLIVLTEWNEFRNLDLSRLKAVMDGDLLVDARNIYDPPTAVRFGFVYKGIGRTAVFKVDKSAHALSRAGALPKS